ncbi:uncharacterized protein BO87DRAFT_323381 [Aspergillus neoniger CBS 115656]|uniref:Uncharacterized protein n=1 Tax=Aspergillus neoniger (strain CBS 115656) TaxID=1448310 RepID=A0A318YY76_ASPNB|nr:hypothetical protein BO87DRAFT_323381 [Aspergillus neoniger CBS 115656]PYH39616.1 hypothetical protein BO87DRAFT_323381 [Aspergillus neoniger CBS 115656]
MCFMIASDPPGREHQRLECEHCRAGSVTSFIKLFLLACTVNEGNIFSLEWDTSRVSDPWPLPSRGYGAASGLSPKGYLLYVD